MSNQKKTSKKDIAKNKATDKVVKGKANGKAANNEVAKTVNGNAKVKSCDIESKAEKDYMLDCDLYQRGSDKKKTVKGSKTQPVEMANLKAMAGSRSGKRDKSKSKISQGTRDILKCIVVLTVIAVFAGALLGAVNFVTYVDADAAILEKIATHYDISSESVKKENARAIAPDGAKSFIKDCFVVLKGNSSDDADDQGPSFTSPNIEAIVYRVIGAGAYSGTVELLVFVKDSVITEIMVYSHEETKGIGTNALNLNHLSKYMGVNLSEVHSFVNASDATTDGEIEFISGATKTSKGVNNALNAVLYAHNNFGGAGQ